MSAIKRRCRNRSRFGSTNAEFGICQNETEFVEKVKYFAAPNQRKYLNDLHNNLREITLKSAICDAELFAKNFETKMWEIWNDFLNS